MEIPIKTDLDMPLKAKKQYWSIEWTFPDSKKKIIVSDYQPGAHWGRFGPDLRKKWSF